MKYYVFASKEMIDFDSVADYLHRISKDKNCAVFSVNDENFTDFLDSVVFCSDDKETDRSCDAFGEDNAIYNLSRDGIKKLNDNPGVSPEEYWKRMGAFHKKLMREKRYRKRIFNRYGNGVTLKSGSLTGFGRYFFSDKDNDMLIPFRYRRSKKENRPLVIFLGGGGTVGKDNFKPLFEFLFLSRGRKIMKRDCNILIPQAMHSGGNPSEYPDYCNELVRTLIDSGRIDRSKIYIYGNSFGGKCTWDAILDDSELYAAAMPVMGEIRDYKNTELNGIAGVPVWIAHSCDDSVVRIDSDDYCFDKLKSLGADVKYTRWEKYGHDMYKRFYKEENWDEWLLSKTNNNT